MSDPRTGPAAAEPPPGRTWGFRALAVTLSAGLALLVGLPLVAHFRARQVIYLEEPGHEVTGYRYVYDALLGWRNIPNWVATTRGQELTINSKGLRDREYTYRKPAGVRRILVVGDSFAWGHGVADHQGFVRVLEEDLRGSDSAWQVLNGGVSGYGTDQEFLWLREEGLRYEPDVVVLAFFMNDLRNNASSRQYGLHKPVFLDLDLELGNVPVPRPDADAPVIVPVVDAVDLTAAIIDGMDTLCRKRESTLMVMKFGRFAAPDEPAMLDLERRFLAKLGDVYRGPFLDLDDAFDREGLTPRALLEGNHAPHWNRFGHEQAARLLRAFLEDEGLLD